MRYLLSLVLLVSHFIAHSQEEPLQEAPNYGNIEKAITKKKSSFYYPLLMKRFQKADTTLTLEDKRHLYYGYQFQEKYNPYGKSVYNDSLDLSLKITNPTEDTFKDIIRYSDSILAENPFDLRTISNQLNAYETLQMEKEFMIKLFQFTSTIDAIISSGDGKEEETAFYVLYVPHEYDLINIIGLEFGGEQSLIKTYDYLTLKENEYDLKGLYFEVSASLNHMSQMFTK
ncbi:DUF4919 domain-containing protein [Neptunitalea lumnitzerae]|uniref:DUF4919 domain-containing protein n=1 Tax=Neptunitalea lumnitzerae TaxID=2965509 RepID=A0ABQ5MEU8_9FLAO|nr:DUF4919 domain-containing protein [Neptunitalea sp. Y10]GLB47925.1 DUF4919 domain-containing protein [Neptunitalea sp. Y10]